MGCVSSKPEDRREEKEEDVPVRLQQNPAPDSGSASAAALRLPAHQQGEPRQRSEDLQPPPDINTIDLGDVTVRGLSVSGRKPSAAAATGPSPQPSSQTQQQQQQQQQQLPVFRLSPTPPSGLDSPVQRSSATSAAADWRLAHLGTSDLSSAHTSTGPDTLLSANGGPKEQHQHPQHHQHRQHQQQQQQQQPQQQRSSRDHEGFSGFDAPTPRHCKACKPSEEQPPQKPSLWHKASFPSPTSSNRSSMSQPQRTSPAHSPQPPPPHTQPSTQPHPTSAAPQQPLWMSTLSPASLPKRAPTTAPAAASSTSPPCSPPVAQLAGPTAGVEHAAAAAQQHSSTQLPPALLVPRWSTSKDLVTSSAETSARSSADEPPVPATLRAGHSNGFGGSHGGHISSGAGLLDLGTRSGRNHNNKTAQATSRLGYATGPRSYTTELPETDAKAEEGLAHSLSAGSNVTFSHPIHQPGLPHKSGPVASLHRSLEVMLLQDEKIAAQVHASMRGIVSLAKETDQLELGRDASGATCINQYVVVKTLGKGSFGKVKLCLNTMDGQMYAIKMVNRSLILKQLQKPTRSLRKRGPRCSIDSQKASGCGAPGNPMSRVGRAAASLDLPRPITNMDRSKADTTGQLSYSARPSLDDGNATALESMMREIAVLKKLDHPHVVKLHEVIDSPSATYMMLVMEFMEQGPVLDTKGQIGFNRIPEPKAAGFFRQACMGLDYLHYNHVVHGDLKPENLLVTGDGVLKIGDFGSARIINDASASSKVSSTPAFQPPEALTWGFTEDPITSDIWALGVCLYCFIFGRLPFTGSCVLDITNSITNDQLVFPEEQSVSSSLKDLLTRLLDKNPAKRITLAETMAHPWVTLDGTQPLPCLGSSVSPPKVVEVSNDEARAAVVQLPLVNLIRTKLKEKHVNQGSYIFREGDQANCVFMIMSGAVEIIRRLDSSTAFEAHSLPEMDQSFSVDMDESFALEQGNELIPDGMDVKNGMLHVNRNKAQELRSRMKALLMGKQEEYVVEVKGPGQVFGEVSLNPDEKVQYCYSARVRTEKAVVIKLTEEAMLRGLLQQLTGDTGDEAASEALSRMATGETHITGKALETIVDDSADVENL